MAYQRCLVQLLEKDLTQDELNNSFNETYLKAIARCKCPVHMNQNPIELPTLKDLQSNLCEIFMDLLDWNLEYIHDDPTGYHKELNKFIHNKCLSNSHDSLFTILEVLEKMHS